MKNSENYFFLFWFMLYFLYKVEGEDMKNRKGFTMIELLTAFVIMAFLLGIGVVSYNFIIDRVAANYYDTLEEELLLAGSDYFTNNRTERPLSGYSAVQIDELIGNKYKMIALVTRNRSATTLYLISIFCTKLTNLSLSI